MAGIREVSSPPVFQNDHVFITCDPFPRGTPAPRPAALAPSTVCQDVEARNRSTIPNASLFTLVLRPPRTSSFCPLHTHPAFRSHLPTSCLDPHPDVSNSASFIATADASFQISAVICDGCMSMCLFTLWWSYFTVGWRHQTGSAGVHILILK